MLTLVAGFSKSSNMKLFIPVVFLIVLVALKCQGWCPRPHTWVTPELYSADNRALMNFVFDAKHRASAVTCARDCVMNTRCASFNYRASDDWCELNNATRKTSPVDLIELKGSLYFDDDTMTASCSGPYDVDNSSCQMLYRAGYRRNGMYIIYPNGSLDEGLRIYCDMETDGGGWMVFQRRRDGTVRFDRTWVEYETGFGDIPMGEFWLGNDIIRRVTATRKWQLMVELMDWEGNTAWADYGDFALIGPNYQLRAREYSAYSTAGWDSLLLHDGRLFTTSDRDHDGSHKGNCARDYPGAWWFVLCADSHLNGEYIGKETGRGIFWAGWKGHLYSLKGCSMKIREVACYHRLV